MSEKILTNENKRPTDSVLKATIGRTYKYFEYLKKMSISFYQEWYFTNPKSGWTLKTYDSKNILYWIFPYLNMFCIAFSLRETEREELIAKNISGKITNLISKSEKHSDGYAVRLEICSEIDFLDMERIVKPLIEIRSN